MIGSEARLKIIDDKQSLCITPEIGWTITSLYSHIVLVYMSFNMVEV